MYKQFKKEEEEKAGAGGFAGLKEKHFQSRLKRLMDSGMSEEQARNELQK
ncbi:MAG: hypothetical protein IKP65_04405 [Alphaproteobacteria bacterium]|nr:hypothetical protein [Alphaproteobacteria bacterium]